jgi:hypothetical protein
MQPFLTPEIPQFVAVAGALAFAGSLFLILLSHQEEGEDRRRLVKVFVAFVLAVLVGSVLAASEGQPIADWCAACEQLSTWNPLYYILGCFSC